MEPRAAFGGYIGPKRLVGLVANTAPYLFDGSSPRFAAPPATEGARLHEHAAHPLGWWAVLRNAHLVEAAEEPTPEAWTDYFALCLAAHFASVTTFVPTDVDTKIRDHLWFLKRPGDELARTRDLALATLGWDIRPISARIVDVEGAGPVSGHDGERLSVLAGGLLALLAAGDAEGAGRFEHEIDAEVAREAQAFETLVRRPGREKELLIVAAAMTHNAGDLDQGLSATGGRRAGETQKARFGRLAHERPERYGGAYLKAKHLYKELMASEGHRHYPLREVRQLRADPELLLPWGPFFDAWGALIARYPKWSTTDRAQVLEGLLVARRRVPGQQGYFRALAGFDRVFPGSIDSPDLARHLGTAARRELKDAELRRLVAIRQESFESSMSKRARALLARL